MVKNDWQHYAPTARRHLYLRTNEEAGQRGRPPIHGANSFIPTSDFLERPLGRVETAAFLGDLLDHFLG